MLSLDLIQKRINSLSLKCDRRCHKLIINNNKQIDLIPKARIEVLLFKYYNYCLIVSSLLNNSNTRAHTYLKSSEENQHNSYMSVMEIENKIFSKYIHNNNNNNN